MRRAKLRRKEITLALQRDEYDTVEATKLRHEVLSTVDKLLTAYEVVPVDAEKRTRTQNVRGASLLVQMQQWLPTILVATLAARSVLL